MMNFDWDPKKNLRNIQKHGISFEAATAVFLDPYKHTENDIWADGEQRLRTIGMIANLRIVVVIYVTEDEHGEEFIRIISARKASSVERNRYAAVSGKRGV